tara:strand:+ start:870 stop:2093 length:1224 start_codon:yes stop_codon:yes gene_type:complete
MLGYKALREVAVWVQMDSSMEVRFTYHPKGDAANFQSKSQISNPEKANTLTFIASGLDVGSTYEYKLVDANYKLLDKGEFSTQEQWQYRKDPPNFSFLIGSCTYVNDTAYDRPGEPYGKGLEIFSAMLEKDAEAMLWLGDNIYLRPADWDSRSGIYYRYSHYKSQPALQEFWKNFHHYAIWDDHDYGPNDANRSFVNKDITLEAFKDFWANPNYGLNSNAEGITGMFSYNDVDFFLLDNRSFRTPNERESGERFILGDEQIAWLIDALVSSKARFKIVAVGGQLLNTAALYENHSTFAEERQKIIELIEEEQIKNVVFLSGDRHKTELSKYVGENDFTIYDFTSSPLSSTSYNSIEEPNTLRVEGTHYGEQNFGMLTFEGSWKERVLVLQTFDKNGELIWTHKIKAK